MGHIGLGIALGGGIGMALGAAGAVVLSEESAAGAS
jgi:hypothetical protein